MLESSKRILALLLALVMLLASLAGCSGITDGTGSDDGAGNIGDGSGGGTDGSDNTGDSDSSTDNGLPDGVSFTVGETVEIGLDESMTLEYTARGVFGDAEWRVVGDAVILEGDRITGSMIGCAFVTLSIGEYSDTVLVYVTGDSGEQVATNPYQGMSSAEFYADYLPATSLTDALWRSECGFMSGSIDPQDQKPTYSSYRPRSGGLYIKNSEMRYGDGGDSYFVLDSDGDVRLTVYRGGAYTSLEEVAAYVFAFCDIPANYVASKRTKPTASKFGEYLRLNHSEFSGSTAKYPYEPALPRISGIGGDLYYYEIDIGTTGTDCDPSFPVVPYNNGKSITRGAARIVYARYDSRMGLVDNIEDKYVFYTYNHYNDFEEYLNYYGGWGEMFGNITGGGKLSSKTDYAPTPYVRVTLAYLDRDLAAFLPRREEEAA